MSERIFNVMILLMYVLVGTYAKCRQRCDIHYPLATCPQGLKCMEAEDVGQYRCYEFCKGTNTGLVPDDRHCARYYDCSDNAAQAGLQVPHLRECTAFQLFDVATSTCKDYFEVSCNGRFEPKNRCDYQTYMTQDQIRTSCEAVKGNTDCSSCEWPGCRDGMTDGFNHIPELDNIVVNCQDLRDISYRYCPIAYRIGQNSDGDWRCFLKILT